MTPDKPDECDCCGYPTKALTHYRPNVGSTVDPPNGRWLCDLCAGTMTSTFQSYPSQYPELAVMKAICYVGNAILDRVGSAQAGKGE